MAFEIFSIDQKACDIVKNYAHNKEVRSQVYKMRTTAAYGLERFWGEQHRFNPNKPTEAQKHHYWRETWQTLVEILSCVGIELPNEGGAGQVQEMANQLWKMNREQVKVAIAILTQLCDSMIWWTQRYKNLPAPGGNPHE